MVPAWEQTLGFAAKHKVKVMLEHGLLSPDSLHSPEKLKALNALIDRVKTNPALESYYIVDEPQIPAFAELGKLVAYLRKRDPDHLAFINLLPILPNIPCTGKDPVDAYQKYLDQFISTVKPDLLSYDYYTFFRTKDGKPYDDIAYFLNLRLVRQAAAKAHIPFMNIVQASTMLPYWRLPSASEMRWLVYTTLAYGGRGISYFLYWGPTKYGGLYQDGKPTRLLGPISELNRELSVLSPELMQLESIAIYHTALLPAGTEPIPESCPVKVVSPGQFVVGLFGRKSKVDSFMIVNRDYRNSVTARIKLTGQSRIKAFDCKTGVWKELGAEMPGEFLLDLSPGDGRLFKL